MSAYICDNKTISALAKAFEQYATRERGYDADDYNPPRGFIIDINDIRQAVGQSLLNQNYASVNDRYGEDTKAPVFQYEDVFINEGIVYGCIRCYEYQSCETDDYFESKIHASMNWLKVAMLERLIRKGGMDTDGWGYPEEDEAPLF